MNETAAYLNPERERRFTAKLRSYWEGLRENRTFPSESDIDPDALDGLWDFCFLVQVRDILNVHDYNYSYLGKGIIRAYNTDALDANAPSMIGPNAHLLGASFRHVIEKQAPIEEQAEFITSAGGLVKYRQCMLPLGETPSKVEAIFGGLSFMYEKEPIKS